MYTENTLHLTAQNNEYTSSFYTMKLLSFVVHIHALIHNIFKGDPGDNCVCQGKGQGSKPIFGNFVRKFYK